MRDTLGEFEQLVLLAILQLDGDVYAARIVEEIERRTGRAASAAAVYVTLRRLEEKRFVESWMSDPGQARGGKSRRLYRVTAAGLRTARDLHRQRERIWQAIAQGARS